MADLDDIYCDIFENNYIVYQRGFNQTEGYSQSMGTYDSALVLENAAGNPLSLDSESKTLTLTFATHLQMPETTEATAEGQGASMPLKTYDQFGVVCDLEDIETKSCTQFFDVYASSYTGIIGHVATFTVVFKTECFQIIECITGTSDVGEKIASFWTWKD